MVNTLRQNILQFDQMVPRYTSYPTAPHFKSLDTSFSYENWLAGLPAGSDISLYLHVPFCPKMCWYCGCNTKITQRYAPVEDYAHLMLREIDMLAQRLNKDHNVTHIHFGGGSPSMLRACDFEKIMDRLRGGFSVHRDAEIAIEVDPRGLTEGRAATYAQSGVNRISLGVQDFDDKVLEAVNRQQPFSLSHQAVDLFRKHGVDQINFDLLYGLPYQTLQTMQTTIDKALSLSPDRVSLFGYAHVPWMKKHMRLIDDNALPASELRYDLFELGAQMLESSGYQSIGIDHFAKPDDSLAIAARSGHLQRNFQGYTSDNAGTMIGIGVSSIGQFQQFYVQNAADMPAYSQSVLAGELPVKKFCPLSEEDKLRGAVIERLMCDFKLCVPQICARYGFSEDFLDAELEMLAPYQQQGILTCDTSATVCIDPAARAMVRIICSVFDAYIDHGHQQQPRHSRAI